MDAVCVHISPKVCIIICIVIQAASSPVAAEANPN